MALKYPMQECSTQWSLPGRRTAQKPCFCPCLWRSGTAGAGFIDPICARYMTKFFYNNEPKWVSRSTQTENSACYNCFVNTLRGFVVLKFDSKKILNIKFDILAWTKNECLVLAYFCHLFMAFVLGVRHGGLDCLIWETEQTRIWRLFHSFRLMLMLMTGKSKTFKPASVFVGYGQCIIPIIL